MPHNVQITVPTSSWWVPYGAENRVSVYVKDDTLGEYDLTPHMVSWDFDVVNNRIAVGTLHLYSITSEEQAYLDRLNRVKVFIGNTNLHVFQIKKVAFDTTQGATITLEGIECKALRTLTDRDTYVYEDTATNTITNALISGIFEQGSISNLGKVWFKAEYDKKLRSLMNLNEYMNSDWWLSWNEATSYNTDYFNMAQTRGSGSSLWTFTTDGEDQNIFLTSNAEDESNIANYIICLGSGNGESQLVSINYHATTNRTYLNGGDTWLSVAIDDDDTTLNVKSTSGFPATGSIKIDDETITYGGKTDTSFTGCTRSATPTAHVIGSEVINLSSLIVDDNSSFPASGTVHIGMEQITYSAKPSSTTLTITARGANSTSIYAHSDNIEVWDAQYTTSSPQVGSSISDEADVIEIKQEFRGINDQNILDLAAQLLLAEKKTIKKNIVVIPINYYEWLDDKKLKIGDTVTLIDSSAGLSGDYEIKRFHVFRSHGAQPSCEVELSKERLDYIKSMVDTEILTKMIADYTQGQSTAWCDTQSGNANATVPLTLNVYVPSEITDTSGKVKLDTIKFTYKTDDYELYTGALSGSTGNSLSNVDYGNVASLSNTVYANVVKGSSDDSYTLPSAAISYYKSGITTFDSWYSSFTGVAIGAYTFSFHAIIGQVNISLSDPMAAYTVYVRAHNATDNTYFPNSYGILVGAINAGEVRNSVDTGVQEIIGCVPFSFLIPLNWTSKSYELEVYVTGDTDASWSVDYRYYGIVGHTHINTYNDANHTNINTFADDNHANPVGTLNADYNLDTDTTTSSNTTIKIYDQNNNLVLNSTRNQTEEKEVDLSTYITKSGFYRIEVYPNANAKMYGSIVVKGGI